MFLLNKIQINTPQASAKFRALARANNIIFGAITRLQFEENAIRFDDSIALNTAPIKALCHNYKTFRHLIKMTGIAS